jgi:hypothetical protein
MMTKNAALLWTLLPAALGTACANEASSSQKASAFSERSTISECRSEPIGASRSQGLRDETISSALEGDEEASWSLVSAMLAAGQRNQSDHVVGCLTLFWAEVAAQNGSLSAAYEIAIYEGPDPYVCHRSKYWARKALERVDEFRTFVVDDAPEAAVKEMIDIRREQLVTALAKVCAAT